MDSNTIAFLAADVLEKLGPYWIVIVTKAAEAIGTKLPEGVSKLWLAIKEQFDSEESSKTAIDQLLTDPQNEKLKVVFEWQLEQILAKDSDFAGRLKRLVKDADTTSQQAAQIGHGTLIQGSNNVAVGKRGVNVCGEIKGSINTGDKSNMK